MKNINSSKKNNFLNAKNGYLYNESAGQEFESVKDYFSRALVTPLLSAVEERELASKIRNCKDKISTLKKRLSKKISTSSIIHKSKFKISCKYCKKVWRSWITFIGSNPRW